MYGRPYKIMLICSVTFFTIRQEMKYEFSLARRLPPMPYWSEIPNSKLVRTMSPMDIAKKAIATAREYLDRTCWAEAIEMA
jgi:hypothetical protein